MVERLRSFLRRLGLAAAWLVVAILISFGGAGIVGGMNHLPGTPARAELTWAGDNAIEPALDGAAADLRAIAASLEELSRLGRGGLSALIARDSDTLETVIAEGGLLANGIRRGSDALRANLVALPGAGRLEHLRVGPRALERRAAIATALGTTDGIAEAWARLADGGLSAARLAALLERHDETVGAAAAHGRGERYGEALETLADADGALADARTLRNRLANTVDVSTLDEWLNRNGRYDAALRRLYEALEASGGDVTAEVRAAVLAEQRARDRLPPDTRGLVVIMSDIARGGINETVIAIEVARGQLDAAVAQMDAGTQPRSP